MDSETVGDNTEYQTEDHAPGFPYNTEDRGYGSAFFGFYLPLYHSFDGNEGEKDRHTVYQDTDKNHGISDKSDDYKANSGRRPDNPEYLPAKIF